MVVGVGENRQKVYSIKGDTVKAVANVHSDSFFDSEQVGNDFYFRTLSDDQSSVDVFRANAEDGQIDFADLLEAFVIGGVAAVEDAAR